MNIKPFVLPLLCGGIAALAVSAVPRETALAQCYNQYQKQVPCEKEKKAKPTAIPPTATDTATPTPIPPTATDTATPTPTSTPVPPVAASGEDPAPQAAGGIPLPVGLFYLGVLAVAGAFIYLGSRLKALQRELPPTSGPMWQKHRESEGNAPTLEFTAAEPKALNAELMFDAYEDRGAVPSAENLHLPSPSTDLAGSEPPDVKYTLFLPDGTPVRDTVHVKMKQASKSSSKTSDDSSTSDSDPDKDSGS